MSEYLDSLPQEVRDHLTKLAGSSGIDPRSDAAETLARGWHEKHEAFLRHTAERGMVPVETFARDNDGGALAMTYSGSIVSIGAVAHGSRGVAYASIGERRDVPQMSVTQGALLASDLRRGESAELIDGPVQKTSPLFAIATFPAAVESAAENAALVEVTDVLARRFVEINRDRIGQSQEQ